MSKSSRIAVANLSGMPSKRTGRNGLRGVPLSGAEPDPFPMIPVPRSEEHTSDQSLMRISYAVFCLKKKKITQRPQKMSVTHYRISAIVKLARDLIINQLSYTKYLYRIQTQPKKS